MCSALKISSASNTGCFRAEEKSSYADIAFVLSFILLVKSSTVVMWMQTLPLPPLVHQRIFIKFSQFMNSLFNKDLMMGRDILRRLISSTVNLVGSEGENKYECMKVR